jgi:hypothetical protein
VVPFEYCSGEKCHLAGLSSAEVDNILMRVGLPHTHYFHRLLACSIYVSAFFSTSHIFLICPGADWAQGIGLSPYLIDPAQLKQRAAAGQRRNTTTPYKLLVLTPEGEEVRKELRNHKQHIMPYNGYIYTDDPSVLISVVPENWPPQNAKVSPP